MPLYCLLSHLAGLSLSFCPSPLKTSSLHIPLSLFSPDKFNIFILLSLVCQGFYINKFSLNLISLQNEQQQNKCITDNSLFTSWRSQRPAPSSCSHLLHSSLSLAVLPLSCNDIIFIGAIQLLALPHLEKSILFC